MPFSCSTQHTPPGHRDTAALAQDQTSPDGSRQTTDVRRTDVGRGDRPSGRSRYLHTLRTPIRTEPPKTDAK